MQAYLPAACCSQRTGHCCLCCVVCQGLGPCIIIYSATSASHRSTWTDSTAQPLLAREPSAHFRCTCHFALHTLPGRCSYRQLLFTRLPTLGAPNEHIYEELAAQTLRAANPDLATVMLMLSCAQGSKAAAGAMLSDQCRRERRVCTAVHQAIAKVAFDRYGLGI